MSLLGILLFFSPLPSKKMNQTHKIENIPLPPLPFKNFEPNGQFWQMLTCTLMAHDK
jgi:hypothetical protein